MSLSSLSHLRHLTIHTEIFFEYKEDEYTHRSDSTIITINTFFQYICKILKTAPKSLEQLTIEVFVDLSILDVTLEYVDLSLLRFLMEPSICYRHLDLYMYTGLPRCPATHAVMRSSLKEQGLIKLVEQGVLVLHPEETAPTMSRVYAAKE